MKYFFLVVGLLLTLGAMVNSNLFYVGLVIMGLSFVFSTNNEASITKIEDRKSLIDRLDKVNLSSTSPNNTLFNIVEDVVAVTAKINNGAKADFSTKSLVNGTFDTINGITSVFKAK